MKTITTMKKLFSMLALLLMTAVGVTAQAQETVMTYPKAEWLKAGDILMHTPGQELFCGVIHPSAGLFEHYFDVDKAADEHRNYIMMLQKNGIRVHTEVVLEQTGRGMDDSPE